MCAIHAKRVTIMPKDIQLARRIRGERAVRLLLIKENLCLFIVCSLSNIYIIICSCCVCVS
ncbi:MAG: hypothetical protein CBC48_04970 [bacterium TMED88]|nr:MAG: hypothetical protein CBC48_04970 [bacterium TMED88]